MAKAKQDAASTGLAQTLTSKDNDGNTVTTVVQPPAPGAKDEVVTTTVTPKADAAATAVAPAPASGQDASQAAAPPATAPTPAAPLPQIHVTAGTALAIRIDQRLSAKQSKLLVDKLLAGPEKLGYETSLWTCNRVANLIKQEFQVHYHPGHVWKVLRHLGWSPQRPVGRAVERDEAAIEKWKKEGWPALKKKPASKGAR